MSVPELEVGGLPSFWQRVASSRRRVLALDYDGTLAPFRVERMAATPLPGTCQLLAQLFERERTELVIVSGRAIDDLTTLLADAPPIPLIGSHGFERRDRQGRRSVVALSEEQAAILERAVARLLAGGERQTAIERKPASVALHTRGRDEEHAARVEERALAEWAAFAEAGFEARRFDGGVELRLRKIDKGRALSEWLGPQREDELVVYIGDDQTDEDAFAAVVVRGGIGIKVGGGADIVSRAQGWVADCQAVRALLAAWVELEAGNQ